jgi:hypothetical protein
MFATNLLYPFSSILKKEKAGSSESLVDIYQATWRQPQKIGSGQVDSHLRKNLLTFHNKFVGGITYINNPLRTK